jgi:excisionase family DNA binding protein
VPVPGALLLRVEEVADQLGLSKGSIRLLIRDGKLRAVKIGKSVRVPTVEVERFVKELTEAKL